LRICGQGVKQELADERKKATVSILKRADVIVASLVGAGHEQVCCSVLQRCTVFECVAVYSWYFETRGCCCSE